MAAVLNWLKNIFAPNPESGDEQHESKVDLSILAPDEISANRILDALLDHFRTTAKKLSTKYNYLYHTSFTIYIKASNYDEMSDSLPFLAGGAEKMLIEEIKKHVGKNIGSYHPHSKYWQFQLVQIPSDAEIDGVAEEEMQQGALIQIQSTLFPPEDAGSEPSQGNNRIVTTVHGVNSLRAIRNCINPEILSKLYLIEKDRIKLSLNLDGSDSAPAGFSRGVATPPPPAPGQSGRGGTSANARQQQQQQQRPVYFATLEAQDGEFLNGAGNNVIHTVAMTADELHIVGRSAMRGEAGIEVVRVNSDRILTPHVKIRRNPSTGDFQLCAIGTTKLNQRTLIADPTKWIALSKKSTIILADEVQVAFKANM